MSAHTFLASPEDGKEILRILESSAARGSIELLYTRRPDAYASYMREPGEALVFVSKDGDRCVGTCAELIREVYIGGKPAKAAYLCGLKKDAGYPGGIGFSADFIRSLPREDIDFYYCSVVADNSDARKMFEKSRRLFKMQPLCRYTTYILSSKVRINASARGFTFGQAEEKEMPSVIDFLNREGKSRDLFPVIRPSDLFGLTHRDFYLLKKDGQTVAAAALWVQTGYKQYVVKKYRGLMRLARVLDPLLPLFGYIRLPKEDRPLDFPMLSFFVCRDGNEEYCRVFLNEIKREVNKKYGMFVMGVPEDHFAAPLLRGLPSIHFDTLLYEIQFPHSGRTCKKVDAKRLSPECGML